LSLSLLSVSLLLGHERRRRIESERAHLRPSDLSEGEVHAMAIAEEVVIVCLTSPTSTREKSRSGSELAKPTMAYEMAAPPIETRSTERRPSTRSESMPKARPPTI